MRPPRSLATIAFLLVPAPDPLAQKPLAEIGGAGENDWLGYSVDGVGDLDGDGHGEWIVGARQALVPAPGYALLIDGADGSVLRTFVGDQTGDLFGHAVAGVGDVSGDGMPDVAVGAPGANLVRVFSGASGAVVLELYGKGFEAFGTSIAGVRDLNGDGRDEVLVGAPRHSTPSATFSGRCALHSGFNGIEMFDFVGEKSVQLLGHDVAAVGDVDADGLEDFAASSLDDFGGPGAKVWIWTAKTGGLHLSIPSPTDGESFGQSIAGVGDVDGDERPDLAVGSPTASVLAPSAGAVRLYSLADGSLIREHFGDEPYQQLGWSVDGVDDADGDGRAEVLAGAWSDDANGPNAGRANLYSGGSGTLLYSVLGRDPGDALGFAVAGVGDVDGDGAPDFAAAAYLADDLGKEGGTARVFSTAPALSASQSALSVFLGGLVSLDIDAGAAFAGDLHFVLGSLGQTEPGFVSDGVYIPLASDAYLAQTLYSPGSPPLLHGLASLDAAGSGGASFLLLPTFDPSLFGLEVSHAAVVLDVSAAGEAAFATNPVTFTLVP